MTGDPTTYDVSISGSRVQPTREQAALIRREILALPRGARLVTGGCVGVDALAARIGTQIPYTKVHVVLPSDRTRVDPFWRNYCTSWEEMPLGTGYRQRDARVVALGRRLLAFPLYAEQDPRSRRSGTWMTVRMARRAGIQVDVFILSEVPQTP